MKLEVAKTVAEEVVALLKPHCRVIEIGGSIRRCKPEPKDIEIVCIPKTFNMGLFEDGFAQEVNKMIKVKGEPDGKYTQRVYRGCVIDIFMPTFTNYGYIMMLRTGSKDWNQRVMLPRLKGNGYKPLEGFIYYKGEIRNVPDETTMFQMMGMDYVKPQDRK